MIAQSVQYTSDREQFGKAIGANQAVKHLLADVAVQIEYAKPVTYRAAYTLGVSPTRADFAVSHAKSAAARTALMASRHCIQVHGAMGYTWECDVQIWAKRAWALAREWGDEGFHNNRIHEWLLRKNALLGPNLPLVAVHSLTLRKQRSTRTKKDFKRRNNMGQRAEAYIVDAIRSPTGKRRGSLATVHGADLAVLSSKRWLSDTIFRTTSTTMSFLAVWTPSVHWRATLREHAGWPQVSAMWFRNYCRSSVWFFATGGAFRSAGGHVWHHGCCRCGWRANDVFHPNFCRNVRRSALRL